MVRTNICSQMRLDRDTYFREMQGQDSPLSKSAKEELRRKKCKTQTKNYVTKSLKTVPKPVFLKTIRKLIVVVSTILKWSNEPWFFLQNDFITHSADFQVNLGYEEWMVSSLCTSPIPGFKPRTERGSLIRNLVTPRTVSRFETRLFLPSQDKMTEEK